MAPRQICCRRRGTLWSSRAERSKSQRWARAWPFLLQVLLEVSTTDIFHYQEGAVVGEVEVENADQVGVLQSGQDPALLQEAVPVGARQGQALAAVLDHHVLAEERMHG